MDIEARKHSTRNVNTTAIGDLETLSCVTWRLWHARHWQSVSRYTDPGGIDMSVPYIEGILPKGSYPPCLRMADRALLAGYPRHIQTVVIGIDHDTVCAGVVGTAIRNSTSCAGRCAAACGRAGRHNECCSGLQYQPRQRRPYKWSISILPRSQFTKSKGNLRSRRLVPLFVPIGVCVTTYDDGTASDVTIGMWRHNQQVTNHERNGKPWFSLPK